ncbi:MAG: hypothetical protein WCT14_07145 [Treponemataceae bacterium]
MKRKIIDCDVIAGFWPKGRLPIAPDEVSAALLSHGIREACVVSARGIFFDHAAGNREALSWAEKSRTSSVKFHPTATIDLRRFLGYKEEIREMSRSGIRIFRLFPEYQGWDFDHPGFRRVAAVVAEENGTLFVKGKPGKILAALGSCDVSLLIGTHFYDLAEALALWEEGRKFRLSTTLLHGPGSIDIAREHGGEDSLVFGSGTPISAPGASVAVLEAASLSEDAKEKVLSRTMSALLQGGYHGR